MKQLDADFDGADEVDSRFNLLKGFGGALVREKIVAASVEEVHRVGRRREKLFPYLGARKRLPVEVIPFGVAIRDARAGEARDEGGAAQNADGSEYISDNGNPILDCVVTRDPQSGEAGAGAARDSWRPRYRDVHRDGEDGAGCLRGWQAAHHQGEKLVTLLSTVRR